ncbi:MAG: hypothetical protein HRT56_01940 [Coraliomargarita sp.]|nr:hypothetical protein [Coraliomargarita sp.]
MPASYEPFLAERGFVVGSCAKAAKWLRTTGPSMCGLADVQDEGFTKDFQQRHGLTPAEICQLSQLLPSSSE